MIDPFDDPGYLEALAADENTAASSSEPTDPVVEGSEVHLTDAGNATRLVTMNLRRIRYADGYGWLVYDGCRWRVDQTDALTRQALAVAKALYHDAGNAPDEQTRKDTARWALASEQGPRVKSVITLAQADDRIRILAERLDADPWLFNVQNGTLNLQTGELRPHDPADVLTRLAPVSYRPDARSKLWDDFIDQVTGGDTELRTFLQRATGYSLTGITRERVLMFAHGPTSTGKSTYTDALFGVFGDYAANAEFDTFVQQRGQDGKIRSDLAALVGA